MFDYILDVHKLYTFTQQDQLQSIHDDVKLGLVKSAVYNIRTLLVHEIKEATRSPPP